MVYRSKLWLLFLFVAAACGISAQTPQWNWAKGVGGNQEDQLLADNQIKNAIQLDSAGNVYELVSSGSSNTITFGPYSFTNPYSASFGNAAGYFVKYSPQGTVLWAKQFPQQPAAVGGGPVVPRSLFTDKQGYSTLLIGYRDSIRLGNMFFSDSTITLTHSGVNYAIARYDPDGNVIALKAHSCTRSGMQSIQPFYNNQILALGLTNTTDTLEGQPLVTRGYFFAIMDSVGDILKVKSIGYDTTTELLVTSGLAIGNKSVYIFIPNLYAPVIHQSTIPTGPLDAYLHKGYRMLVKFDSLLNFQWFKFTNGDLYIPMTTDKQDNVFLSAFGNSSIPEDTLVFDTIKIRFPFKLPFDGYSYLGVVKIDGSGKLRWMHTLTSVPNTGAVLYRLCTDHLNNVYMAGRTSSLLLVGNDTIYDAGNLFVTKLSKDGTYQWTQNTKKAAARSNVFGLADDGHGNIYMNGMFSDPNAHIAFGNDSLICHTPVSGKPLADDVFLARLGNCDPTPPTLSPSSPLSWCGTDSVTLTTSTSNSYLWSNGDTTRSITAQLSGVYAVYAVDTLGCYAQSKPDTINAYPQPVLHLSATQNSGTQIAIAVATAGTPAYNYLWNDSISGDTITHPNAGWYYVVVTDTNGCMANDSIFVPLITGETDFPLQSTISIYPNPSTGSFYIEMPCYGGLRIYNELGALVQQQIIAAGKSKIETSMLSKGTYVVEVIMNSAKYNNKLIIE